MLSTAQRTSRRTLFTLVALLAIFSSAAADTVNRDRNGVALGGYDPVAYFAAGKPVKGDQALTAQYEGATYQFSSTPNRDAFIKDPARYVPQYGGFCAYAVSRGHTASIDPQAWRIVDGRLYLNYSLDVKALWEQEVPANIKKADANWPTLRGKP